MPALEITPVCAEGSQLAHSWGEEAPAICEAGAYASSWRYPDLLCFPLLMLFMYLIPSQKRPPNVSSASGCTCSVAWSHYQIILYTEGVVMASIVHPS